MDPVHQRHHVFLIGFHATGKTRCAKLIANRLGLACHDLDALIVKEREESVAAIFAKYGAEFYRTLETKALKDYVASEKIEPAVIALGGGVAFSSENRAILLNYGWIVHFDSSPETILGRIRDSTTTGREPHAAYPLLKASNPLEMVTLLKELREPYLGFADITTLTDKKTPEQISEEVVARLQSLLSEKGGSLS